MSDTSLATAGAAPAPSPPRADSAGRAPSSARPMSIRLLVAVVVVLPVAAVSAALVTLSSDTSTRIAEDLASTLTESATQRVRDDLATFLGHAIEISDRYDRRLREGRLPSGGDMSAWRQPLFDDLATTPNVASICFGNTEGDAVWLLRGREQALEYGTSDKAKESGAIELPVDPKTGSPGTKPIRVYKYDPRTRPWYETADRSIGALWTPIYFWYGEKGVDKTTGTGYTRVVRDQDGKKLGVLVIDVTLKQLTEMVKTLPIADRGFAFIVDERGLLVAASDGPVNSPTEGRMKLGDSVDPFARGVAALPYLSDVALSTPIHRFTVNGQPARATVRTLSPYPGIHWRVIVGAPDSAFLADAQALQRRQVLMAVIAAAGSAVLALLLGRQVTQPLLRLRDHVRRVGRGDLNSRLDLQATRELRELSHELNRMSEGLSERIELERSLGLAMEVQQSLLPAEIPQPRGFEIAAQCRYCESTGGDYYDFVATELAGERPIVVIGDALGHGISSALLMATARAALHAIAVEPCAASASLGQMMTRVNAVLCQGARNGRFMTMMLMAFDPDTRGVRWARAGHEPCVLYLPTSDSFPKFGGGGIPLGIEPNFTYEEQRHDGLEPGTLIVAATDGLFEAQNAAGEMFGKPRVREIVREVARQPNASAKRAVDAIDAALTQFLGDAKVKDDVTFLAVRVLGDASAPAV